MRLRTAMILLLAAGCLVLPATGGDDGPGSAVERQVRQALGKLVKSYNAHDTEAVAACWAVDAVYVDRDSDAEIVGREKLLEAYKEIFQRHPQIEMVADVHSGSAHG